MSAAREANEKQTVRPAAEYATALVADLVGSAAALLVATQAWQTITTARPRPLGPDVLAASGRTLDTASTALALVALAGVLAVLVSRGFWRRLVGVVLVAAGAGLVWRAAALFTPVGSQRALELVRSRHQTVTTDPGVRPVVSVHAVWPTLSLLCGAVVVAAGVLVAARGHRWRSMSSRYERRASTEADPETRSARAATTMWNALDRGDDPTSSR